MTRKRQQTGWEDMLILNYNYNCCFFQFLLFIFHVFFVLRVKRGHLLALCYCVFVSMAVVFALSICTTYLNLYNGLLNTVLSNLYLLWRVLTFCSICSWRFGNLLELCFIYFEVRITCMLWPCHAYVAVRYINMVENKSQRIVEKSIKASNVSTPFWKCLHVVILGNHATAVRYNLQSSHQPIL